MQAAGVEGEQVYFILEDYQLINPEYLDLVNSLLSSGEVWLSGFLLVSLFNNFSGNKSLSYRVE